MRTTVPSDTIPALPRGSGAEVWRGEGGRFGPLEIKKVLMQQVRFCSSCESGWRKVIKCRPRMSHPVSLGQNGERQQSGLVGDGKETCCCCSRCLRWITSSTSSSLCCATKNNVEPPSSVFEPPFYSRPRSSYCDLRPTPTPTHISHTAK